MFRTVRTQWPPLEADAANASGDEYETFVPSGEIRKSRLRKSRGFTATTSAGSNAENETSASTTSSSSQTR